MQSHCGTLAFPRVDAQWKHSGSKRARFAAVYCEIRRRDDAGKTVFYVDLEKSWTRSGFELRWKHLRNVFFETKGSINRSLS